MKTAHIPLFLYPFLNTTSKTRPFEYLRLTSLGVIGALVKVRTLWLLHLLGGTNNCLNQQNDNNTVIHFLLSTEIIPLCLRIMETGSELSKTVAIFIVQKILLDETGLTYICHTYERFYAVGTVLSNMVNQLVETQAVRLLKHVVRCYLRLSDNLRWVFLPLLWKSRLTDANYSAREALRACLPEPLRDQTFSTLLKVSNGLHGMLTSDLYNTGRYGHETVPDDLTQQLEWTLALHLQMDNLAHIQPYSIHCYIFYSFYCIRRSQSCTT